MMSREELESVRASAEARGLPDPLRAFRQHKAGAAKRGIGFDLSFSEWWGIWEAHYHNRGTRSGQMVMARMGDVGPYAVGNVSIKTSIANVRESFGYSDGDIARGLRTFPGMRGTRGAIIASQKIERPEAIELCDEVGEIIEDDGGPKNCLTSDVYWT
jgi:hypothetical protein